MLRAEADIADVVFFLVIEAERVAAGFGRGLIEPELRTQPTQRFDAHHRRALALVLHRRLDGEAGVAPMVRVFLAGDIVLVEAVVRKIVDRLLITFLAHPVYVEGENLSDRLVIIENANFLPYPLHDTDRVGVRNAA